MNDYACQVGLRALRKFFQLAGKLGPHHWMCTGRTETVCRSCALQSSGVMWRQQMRQQSYPERMDELLCRPSQMPGMCAAYVCDWCKWTALPNISGFLSNLFQVEVLEAFVKLGSSRDPHAPEQVAVVEKA
eukprot:780783-Pelagomonas_calceolata.AAC.4